MRFVIISMLLAAAAISAASEVSYRAEVPLNLDGTRQTFSVPQFNPALGILTGIKIRTYARAGATLGIENNSAAPGLGRGSFTAGVNLEAVLPDTSTYYLHYSGFQTKGREKNLSAYDGVTDWGGASGSSDNFSATASTASSLSDPFLLALATGFGNVQMVGYLGYQLTWAWYNGRTDSWPEMNLAGGGTTSVVVTYVYSAP